MCGIVGYVGRDGAAAVVVVDGLKQLEYRGYDSAGLAVVSARGTRVVRRVGRVRELEAALPARLAGGVGVGHTRWATHGPATEANAHPQRSADGHVSVVHNGIIDNADALRARLAGDGVAFTSDTDTEVVAALIARSAADTLEDAVLDALADVVGTYALAVVDERHPDRVVVARHGSPLILGVADKAMLVASDVAALVRHTSQVVHLHDGELATVTAAGFHTFTREVADTGRRATTAEVSPEDLATGAGGDRMHTEIHEQPDSVRRMLSGRLDERFATARLDGLELTARELRSFRRVTILGCGSAYYVGELGATTIEGLARIPAHAEPASEFRYRNPIVDPDTLYIAVSQSGETADTAFAVEEIQRKGGRVVGLVNVVGSTIARACEGGVYLHAGPEVSVASTKALTNMAVGFALIALLLGRVRDLSVSDGRRIAEGLGRLPDHVTDVLKDEERLATTARELTAARSLFFVGRLRCHPVAREGAQKFKEITYRHAEAYPTSELKHGPLALIDETMPTVALVPDDEVVERNIAAVRQILARRGPVVAVTHPGVAVDEAAHVITVPRVERELDPILLTIPLQLLAYHAAAALGHDIDRPRNLAKSVTVE